MYTDEQRRSHIFDLQTFLRRIQRSQGYAQPLAPDGIFGPETAAAVRNFQRQNGLPVTGTADYDTWTAIYLAYLALLAGDTLPQAVSFFPGRGGRYAVRRGQGVRPGASAHAGHRPAALCGHCARAADRRIRLDTAAGVRRAQGVFLLPQTGVADRATWEALALFHNSFFGRTPLGWLDKGQ